PGLRSEGYRSHEGRSRSAGFRDRPEGEVRPRPAGPRPERGERPSRPPRAAAPAGAGGRDRGERTEATRPPRSAGFRARPE
ncbi:hypothetical protein J8J32_22280, partial [Mycobacterium tuberculosis]|nr:hypothetical protein [Mycobacterium tuberculosis]